MNSENPLEQPVPDSQLAKAEAFALDIVYGIENGYRGSDFVIVSGDKSPEGWLSPHLINRKLYDQTVTKWDYRPPALSLLVSAGWFTKDKDYVTPTEKAYKLLKDMKAPVTPSVFVSYGRAQSSAFAVLIQKQLGGLNKGLDCRVSKISGICFVPFLQKGNAKKL